MSVTHEELNEYSESPSLKSTIGTAKYSQNESDQSIEVEEDKDCSDPKIEKILNWGKCHPFIINKHE